MSKTEALLTGALLIAAGVCYSTGLRQTSAGLAGLVAVCHISACLWPSAKSLVNRVSSVPAADAVWLKATTQLCRQYCRVRLPVRVTNQSHRGLHTRHLLVYSLFQVYVPLVLLRRT